MIAPAMEPITHEIEQLVQRQLDAYNAKDLTRLLEIYADDAEQFDISGQLLAKGREQLRERFAQRFAEPNLHAQLVHRMVCGNRVIDQELITRTFPEGPGTLELVAIYEVISARIARAWFISGKKTLS